jgi:hypothetical protein
MLYEKTTSVNSIYIAMKLENIENSCRLVLSHGIAYLH